MNTIMKKVVIVTGASSGIGKQTALRFLREGYEVHAGARRLDAMHDLEQHGARLHALDLTKGESIDAFVAEVVAQSWRIDVLVNTAGYGLYGSVEEVPLEAARDQLEVNVFGVAHLIQATLPIMRKQGSGRIINITSIGGKVWTLLGAWYHASKFAVEGFSDSLRNEVRPFGIDVVVIEPGAVKTEWPTIAAENVKNMSGNGPYRGLAEATAHLFMAQGAGAYAPPQVIADVIWRAASTRHPKARYAAPFSARVILGLRRALSDRLFDRVWGRVMGVPATSEATSS
ncbi:MAG TPA: oxidoreductase [Ktedonobacteraceae bacterium]|nr:oxidoreductase [Ktedonobacteraceae bacterium]